MIISTAQFLLVSSSHRLRLQLSAFSTEPSPTPAPLSQIQNDITKPQSWKYTLFLSKARWIAADMICTGRQATKEEANQTPHFSKNLQVRCWYYGVQSADLSDPQAVPEGGEGRMWQIARAAHTWVIQLHVTWNN